jgi:hypothetical protein
MTGMNAAMAASSISAWEILDFKRIRPRRR